MADQPVLRSAGPELHELLTDVRILVVDTGRVWWRLLPQLLSLYLLGWLASQLVLRLAVLAGDRSAWLALALFALNFVALLASLVLILRLVGRELGIHRLIPVEESVADGRDESISRLLAVTLLPFLGLYAAFGQVTSAADQLVTQQTIRYGVLGSDQTVLGVLNDAATRHTGRLVLVVVGVYLVRRVLDLLHDRTGWQALGLLVAFVESFLILVVILGAVRIVQRLRLWLEDRALWGWFASLQDMAAALLARFRLDLPAVLGRLAAVLDEQVWPVVSEVVSQPVIWLAVTALVFGSRVTSLAELWRRGQTSAARLRGARVLAQRRPAGAGRRVGPLPPGVRRAAREAQEAFLGDIDDKYLPTFHSLRLVLRAGLVFLGAFVLVHALIVTVRGCASTALHRALGGHTLDFWIVWDPWVDLALVLPFEPLRLCLLAVAFRRCLELFEQRAGIPLGRSAPLRRAAPVATAVPVGTA